MERSAKYFLLSIRIEPVGIQVFTQAERYRVLSIIRIAVAILLPSQLLEAKSLLPANYLPTNRGGIERGPPKSVIACCSADAAE